MLILILKLSTQNKRIYSVSYFCYLFGSLQLLGVAFVVLIIVFMDLILLLRCWFVFFFLGMYFNINNVSSQRNPSKVQINTALLLD